MSSFNLLFDSKKLPSQNIQLLSLEQEFAKGFQDDFKNSAYFSMHTMFLFLPSYVKQSEFKKEFETMTLSVFLNFLIQWLVGRVSSIWKKKLIFYCVLAHLKVTTVIPLLLIMENF